MKNRILFLIGLLIISLVGCSPKKHSKSAQEILGNPHYLAVCYGGYRENTREIQPTIAQLKEDMKILFAMDIKVLRTYNTKLAQASNLLKAIKELKEEDADFEMYVMLGAWIDCENAWTANPNHESEDVAANKAEIDRAVALAKQYPDIVKIISVGNEAMVHWASAYFVRPNIILKWVNYLQDLKKSGELPANLWITSSDNFASWGGDDASYHTEDLTKLLNAVDYISLHTYPFHDTHYNNAFWKVPDEQDSLTRLEKVNAAMFRAKEHAMAQYQSAADYIKSLGVNKPIHIGETGWASESGQTFYGSNGSKATDDYKAGIYYKLIREWTNKAGMSCFYFEAFDEQWKDAKNPLGSENHFGLFGLNGEAKFAIWDYVDRGAFKGLTRDGHPIIKTFNGDKKALENEVLAPPPANELENQK
jgi:exo-beta-1,3-glucanase (GH17 family)